MKSAFKYYRHRLVSWGTHQLLLPIIRLFVQPPPFPFTMHQLAGYPETSVGKELYNFLSSNGFGLLRTYEVHDVKHVVLGYAGDEEGEACMQFFFWGNGHRSLPVITTVVICWVIMPDYHSGFRAALNRGRTTASLAGTKWVSLLHQPIHFVQQQLQISPKCK